MKKHQLRSKTVYTDSFLTRPRVPAPQTPPNATLRRSLPTKTAALPRSRTPLGHSAAMRREKTVASGIRARPPPGFSTMGSLGGDALPQGARQRARPPPGSVRWAASAATLSRRPRVSGCGFCAPHWCKRKKFSRVLTWRRRTYVAWKEQVVGHGEKRAGEYGKEHE